MIDLTKAESAIFSSSIEDHIGLYEAIWELNSLYPNESLGEKYKAAEFVIKKLLDENLIALFERKEEVYTEIQPQELEKLLSNPVSWYPDRDCITFTSTKKGDAKYFNNPGK